MAIAPSLALVTGATSGIGEALCRLLAKKGVNLIITGRQAESLEALRQELGTAIWVQAVTADLSEKKEVERLIQLIHRHVPDLVINNAGFGLYGEILTYETSRQKQILEVNAMAVLELTIEAARALLSKKKKGTILNVSSAAAFQVFPDFAIYAASKAFVNQFSQAFNEETQPFGIQILAACPGMTATHFQERAGGKKDDKRKKTGTMTPEFVADQIWSQIQCGKPLMIIDWKYRFLTAVSRLFPKRLVAKLLKKNIVERIPPRRIIEIEHE